MCTFQDTIAAFLHMTFVANMKCHGNREAVAAWLFDNIFIILFFNICLKSSIFLDALHQLIKTFY
jgi:hypothetical protein